MPAQDEPIWVPAQDEPIWVWQTLDSRDGRWGTISVYLATPASLVTGDGQGHNLVLQTRSEDIARGQMRELAETHLVKGDPIRLMRFVPDPDFEAEVHTTSPN